MTNLRVTGKNNPVTSEELGQLEQTGGTSFQMP
jgi:hypothetical protein